MHYSQREGIQVWLNENPTCGESNAVRVGFAHRRLSIIDLSTGSSQPMTDDYGRYCVAYNGEIYNYLELKEELKGLDIHLRQPGIRKYC